MVIPESLLKFENDSAYVEVQTDSQVFEKRFVEVGLSDGINIEVLKGLSFDDEVKGEKMDPKAAKENAQVTES
jgi:HlyD family secretion protein